MTENSPNTPNPDGDKLAKLIARAGLYSRRDAENVIRAGRVKLNGTIITIPAERALPTDIIMVDDKPLTFDATCLYMFHKPISTLTTRTDPQNRATIFECEALRALEQDDKKLLNIGRLDMSSEGLLLLTNDGALKRYMEKSDLPRRYKVRYFGRLDERKLKQLEQGVTIDEVKYQKVTLHATPQGEGKNSWLEITIYEGKNREIRKMIEYCGGTVNRLIRLQFGGFTLGTLPSGAVSEIPHQQCKTLLPDFFKKGLSPTTTLTL